MSRSLLTYLIKKAFNAAVKTVKVDEDHSDAKLGSSRREFLVKSAISMGMLTGLTSFTETDSLLPTNDTGNIAGINEKQPVITIIGAGMAGLNFAYQLKKAGLKSNIYESSNRFGGRMFTVNNLFGEGITTDFGGEWVDEEHYDIKNLCHEFNIELYDSRVKDLKKHTYYFEGKVLTQQNIYDALSPYVIVLKHDIDRLPPEITLNNVGALIDLDQLSITEYLNKINLSGWLYRFLILAMESEYGAEANLQSAINLLIILRPPQSIKDMDDFEGQGAEIMKIKGGSQHLCKAVYEKVQQQVHFLHELIQIDPDGKGFLVSFKVNNEFKQLKTDYLVVTIPFSRLRSVRLNLPLPPIKIKAINELGYGNSGKFIMGFSDKPWVKMGHIGKLTTDLNCHTGWDSSLMQSDTIGSYTIFSGGRLSEKLRDTEALALAAEFIPELEKVYPGMAVSYTGKNEKFIWETYPHTRGAYSYYKVGQWTGIGGHEAEPFGQLHFAGEHCSQLWQGYMNGAALSARLGSVDLIAEIKRKFIPHKS